MFNPIYTYLIILKIVIVTIHLSNYSTFDAIERYRVLLLIIKKSKFLLIGPTVPGSLKTLNNDTYFDSRL